MLPCVGKPQERNLTSRDMHVRLRKKDYDFTLADTVCNNSFNILRQKEGTKKDGQNRSVEENMDLDTKAVVSENGCTNGVSAELIGATEQEEGGCEESTEEAINEEPAVKKQKLGPVLDEDLIPLKAKVRR